MSVGGDSFFLDADNGWVGKKVLVRNSKVRSINQRFD